MGQSLTHREKTNNGINYLKILMVADPSASVRNFLLSAIGNGQEAGSVDVRVKCGSAETTNTPA